MKKTGRPRKPESEKVRTIQIALPPATLAKLDTLGPNRSGSIAGLIEAAKPETV